MIPCSFDPASEDYADFILRYSSRTSDEVFKFTSSTCINFISREFAIVHTPLESVLPLSISRYTYTAIPKLYSLLDTTALESSGVLDAVRQPAIRASGRGVMIGIIDTGIDYTSPLFRRADGTTRIVGIWDQTITSDTEPQAVSGFQPFYGTVYIQDDINNALRLRNPYELVPSRDTNGHGTFLASIAGGSRIQTPTAFSGSAPEAELAVVKLKPAKQYLRNFFLIAPDVPAYQENDIMSAVSFLLGLAGDRRMPLVLLFGLGTSQGSHDGTSPLCLQLQALTSSMGLVAVAGAGNETGYHHHYLGNLSEQEEWDDVELRVSEGENGFCMELWANEPDLYTIGFVSPSGEQIERVPLVLGKETEITFALDATKIALTYQTYESSSGSQLIFLRFETPSPGIWHIRVYPVLYLSGQFHIWLPQNPFIAPRTIFLRSDPDTTITDPGNGQMPVTVGAYNHLSDSIYIHSSRGYTRSSAIKPDLCAPGVDVQGASSSDDPNADPENLFTRKTGTSVSAGLTAGACAVILSWAFVDGNAPYLTSTSVKAMLIGGSGRKPAFRYPNRQWGYGTLNLYHSFLNLRE